MTTVIFPRSANRPARQIVTSRLLGDPPADLAERRAQAAARAATDQTLRTHAREIQPGARRKTV